MGRSINSWIHGQVCRLDAQWAVQHSVQVCKQTHSKLGSTLVHDYQYVHINNSSYLTLKNEFMLLEKRTLFLSKCMYTLNLSITITPAFVYWQGQ